MVPGAITIVALMKLPRRKMDKRCFLKLGSVKAKSLTAGRHFRQSIMRCGMQRSGFVDIIFPWRILVQHLCLKHMLKLLRFGIWILGKVRNAIIGIPVGHLCLISEHRVQLMNRLSIPICAVMGNVQQWLFHVKLSIQEFFHGYDFSPFMLFGMQRLHGEKVGYSNLFMFSRTE